MPMKYLRGPIWRIFNPCRTPIDTESKLGLDGDPVTDPTMYRSLAGALQYLTFTHPYITYSIQQLTAYLDVDWVGRPSIRRSTSGAEAEYRGVDNVVAKTAWLHNLLLELHSLLHSTGGGPEHRTGAASQSGEEQRPAADLGFEGHLKRDCPKKKSSGFVKKGKRDQDSDSSNDEGNAYFGEALVVVGNDEMAELVMDSGGSYHMTHMRDFLYDFKGFDGGSVQLGDNRTCTIKGTWKVKIQLHDESSFILEDVKYVPGLRRSLISLGTLEKEGYTVKMQMGRIKVIKGCRVMMTGIRKKNCVYTLEAKVITFGVQKHGGPKQVGFKQLGHKQVRFKQLSHGVETGFHGVQDDKRVWFEVELQGAQGDREAEVFQVSNDDATVAQRWLEDKQPEEKKNTDCLVKEQEKVHLGIKVGANIMITGVPGKVGAEGNVAGKKKVKESMKANLGKLLKYNAWSTRWSPIRGSSTRKR
ncbi:zinc finger, CCHC-type containing protein [Tanacetum coccineum]